MLALVNFVKYLVNHLLHALLKFRIITCFDLDLVEGFRTCKVEFDRHLLVALYGLHVCMTYLAQHQFDLFVDPRLSGYVLLVLS